MATQIVEGSEKCAPMSCDEFVKFVRKVIPCGYLQKSGRILFSAYPTGPRKLYMMGLNPGGDPLAPPFNAPHHTLDHDLSVMCARHPDFSAIDEDWGGAAIQGRLRRIIDCIARSRDYPKDQVCLTNFIFERTQGQQQLVPNWATHVNNCWPVHERLLGHVRPRVILVYGNGPYTPFSHICGHCRSASQTLQVTESDPINELGWVCRTFDARLCDQPVRVLGIPHPARTGVDLICRWIQSMLP